MKRPPPSKNAVASGYSLRGRQGMVIDSLGRAIVGGTYQPGTLLPKEGELIAELGVSRTSVREAMKVLAAKGLVEIRQKIGTRVRARDQWNVFDSDILAWALAEGMGAELMQDLVQLRQILEPTAARLAAARATIADLASLDRTVSDMARHAREEHAYAESDVGFHLAVYAASHNAFLHRFGLLVVDSMKLTFDLQQAATPGGPDFTDDAAAHREVFSAINRNDPDRAAESMLTVVLNGKTALIAALESLRPSATGRTP